MTDVLKAAALDAAVQVVDLASIPERRDRVRQVVATAVEIIGSFEYALARREERLATRASENVDA